MMKGYKTYLGLLVAAVPTLAGLFGFDVLPTFSEQFVETAERIITVVGLGIAAYGRLVAVVPGWFAKR